MGNKVKIGLLGAGRIGKLHDENLAHAIPNADLYAVSDPCRTQSRPLRNASGVWKICAARSRNSGRRTAAFRVKCPRHW